MFSFIIGTIGATIALVGWFGFHSVFLLIVGIALYIIETIIEWKQLTPNAKIFDVVIFAVGCIIASFFTSAPWYVGGMLAIAIYSLILGVGGIIEMFIIFKRMKWNHK